MGQYFKSKEVKQFRMLGEENITRLRYELTSSNLQNIILNSNNISEATEKFMNTLESLVNECCPKRTKIISKSDQNRKKSNTKWYTPYLSAIRNLMIICYDKAKNGTSKDKEDYIFIKRLYREKIKAAKKKANDDYINNSKNKCKAAWSVINEEIGKNKSKRVVPIAPNTLNEYFVNNVKNMITNASNEHEYNQNQFKEMLENSEINENYRQPC